MSVRPGTRLGHYEVLSAIGAGGMGEVYRARDCKLGREVAIKVLPAGLARDKQRLARLESEAKSLAALNHPNVATLHGFERAGDASFLVMELVEGEDLATLLERGPLPVDKAMSPFVQLAEGLEAAHARGVIHRDLKPANLKITPDGRLKILDFGLAKPSTLPELGEEDSTAPAPPRTQEGAILGTASYMSPEQARGRKVDERTDIFSFGAVLYETLSGRKAFSGDSTVSTLAAVIERDPPSLRELGVGVPLELDRLIGRCLRKDARRRHHHMSDVRILLEDLQDESRHGEVVVADEQPGETGTRRRSRAVVALTVVAVVASAFGYWLGSARDGGGRFAAPIPLTADPGFESFPSLSPDGAAVAFSAGHLPLVRVFVKLIGEEESVPLTSSGFTDRDPRWSPDGRYIAFGRYRRMGEERIGVYVIPRIGGRERKLTEVESPWEPDPLLTWSADSRWLVVSDRASSGEPYALFRVSAESGDKLQVTFPPANYEGDTGGAISRDGSRLAFTRRLRFGVSDLYLLDLGEDLSPAGEPRQLTSGVWMANRPAWTLDDREIVFCSGVFHASTLWRVAVDGSAPPRRLPFGDRGAYAPSLGSGGRMVFQQQRWITNLWRLDLDDRGQPVGKPELFVSSTFIEEHPVFSPDGKRVAFVSERSGSAQLWLTDRDGKNLAPLTSLGPAFNVSHAWSPDGKSIAFFADADGVAGIYVVEVEGRRQRQLITGPGISGSPYWSGDGQSIFFLLTSGGSREEWTIPAKGGEAVKTGARPGWRGPDADDRFRYWTEGPLGDSVLFREPIAGGESTEVLSHIAREDWLLTSEGIYFVGSEAAGETTGWSLRFYDLASGTTRTLIPVRVGTGFGISLSPDGRTILYTQADEEGADLMLVEGFL